MDHDTNEKETQYIVGSKDLADVRAGSCQLRTCPNMRCLETRTGKTECVKEPWNQRQSNTELNTTLLDACIVGDVARVKFVLSDGRANVNSRGKNNMTPVMNAAKGGHEEVFFLLVRESANLSLVDNKDRGILDLACIGGSVEIVKHILTQKGVGINNRDEHGWTPVMKAALYKNRDAFDVLVEARADLSLVTKLEQTILHVACEGGDVGIIKYLLKQYIVNVDTRDMKDWTPVMYAANGGHEAAFDVLVDKGADVSLVSKAKKNILHLACDGGNTAIIKYLLKYDIVGIDVQDEIGWTPVMHAARSGHKDVFDVLVARGADLPRLADKTKRRKRNILHLACKGGNVEIIKYLLKHDIVDIDSQDGDGWTPVMLGAFGGHKEVFDVLVDKGANLSLMGDNKETIFHMACEGGNVEIINYLLKHDIVDIDSQDGDGWTPVMLGAFGGHKGVFDVLVDKGADLSHKGDNKETILHAACQGGNVEIIKYLLKDDTIDINSRNRDGLAPLMHAAMNEDRNAFDVLVEAGADLSQVSSDNETILHVACKWGNIGIIKYLLTHEIVDINSRNGKGWTPVMHAARNEDRKAFDVLVEAGADLSQVSSDNETILHAACEWGNIGIIKYLLTHKIVDINSQDRSGLTPLMHAAIEGGEGVFDLLVKWGADVSQMDDDNNTILHLACIHDKYEIVRYLLTHHLVDVNSSNGDNCNQQ